jgi:hypothetical protein
MSFDPSAVTVKEAVKQLSGLSDSELSEVYDAELDGKGRKSLLDEITAKRDALREDAAPAAVAAPKRVLIRRPARPGAAAATYVKIVK